MLARFDADGLRLWCRWCKTEHPVPWEEIDVLWPIAKQAA